MARPACRQAGHFLVMNYFVYIIQSITSRKFYTGMTIDIDRRLKEHNAHESNTPTTKSLFDYQLIFCQVVQNRKSARILEKYLKSGAGREIRTEIVEYICLGS